MALKNICSEGYTHLSASVPPFGMVDTWRFFDSTNGWSGLGSLEPLGIYKAYRKQQKIGGSKFGKSVWQKKVWQISLEFQVCMVVKLIFATGG